MISLYFKYILGKKTHKKYFLFLPVLHSSKVLSKQINILQPLPIIHQSERRQHIRSL